jgi:hypothetical protein
MANVFDGTNPMEYEMWKEALHREVAGLGLDAYHWLQILQIRTTGEAQEIVKSKTVIQREVGSEEALEDVWKALESRFPPQQQPAQQLLRQLTAGPPISKVNTKALFAFANDCDAALRLLNCNHPDMHTLNDHQTQR